ncbi:dihydropteroate synthase [Pelagibacterales bacterium SAG-MED15]|nr:dihydropteroate synthase [Pelagibacterales bacterium SAG-MED15]
MKKYYTRACNFFYGKNSEDKIKKKKSLPLNGNPNISFDSIELITSKNSKIFHISEIKYFKKKLKNKIKKDLEQITKKKFIKNLNFKNTPVLMGVVNLTPDSFSDGGRFNKKKSALKHTKYLISKGCKIIDIGGESTRPGAKDIDAHVEWKRIFPHLNKIKRLNKIISLDTRKSSIMENGIKNKVKIINDVSGLNYDPNSINILKKTNIPFIINHTRGKPDSMQKKPTYKNVLTEIFDFFENKIIELRNSGISHDNIILDPGIGFGKNLKHNITLIKKISLFHSLGLPIMIGTSRKRFIKDISGVNDSKNRLGGTISSCLYSMMQGVQILRVHDVNEVNQSIKVFKSLF